MKTNHNLQDSAKSSAYRKLLAVNASIRTEERQKTSDRGSYLKLEKEEQNKP